MSKAIIFSDEEGDFERVMHLKCVCGHLATDHSFSPSWSIRVVYVGQCIRCGFTDDKRHFICEEFQEAK